MTDRTRARMDQFSPEFAQFWQDDKPGSPDEPAVSRRAAESPSTSQREALEALAERVSAARSIV